MVAISDGRPKQMGIKEIIDSYLNHQIEVVTNRTNYDLSQAESRMHIVEGLMKALSILDEVIALIRNSKNKKDAKDNLVAKYDFTDAQAEAIVTLQLYRLTNTDIVQLEEEHDSLKETIAQLRHILDDHEALLGVIKDELKEIKGQFKTPRLSKIEAEIAELKIDKTVTVPSEDVVVSITRHGYIKRTSLRSFKASGIDEIGAKDDDALMKYQMMNTLDVALAFTNKGRYLYLPVDQLADVKWKDLGQHISQLVAIDDDEVIIDLCQEQAFEDTAYYILATKQGMIKKSNVSLFKTSRYNKPLIAMKVKDNDEVINVSRINKDTNITVLTNKGMSLTYSTEELSDTGLRAAGVKSINLKDEDFVVLTSTIEPNETILMATQRGALKRISFKVLQVAKRAQRGLTLLKELKKNPHRIVSAAVIRQDDKTYELITEKTIETGNVTDIHLSEQYTNGSFVVDVKEVGEVKALFVKK